MEWRGLRAVSAAAVFVGPTRRMSQLRSGVEPLSVSPRGSLTVAPPLEVNTPPRSFPVRASPFRVHRSMVYAGAVVAMSSAWAIGFGYLAVVRHLALGSHAEDLGFTDQVIWNFLRGQWFRMSIYSGATWNTELDISQIHRPDSLLAFHFEPMLLLFVPLYALGGGAVALLVIQAIVVAAGAIPAYRLGAHFTNKPWCGLVVAATYLLSPLGQWAVLSDFHTSTLAAPLLLLSLERLLVARKPTQSLLAAALAATAREDVGPVLAVLGCMLLLRRQTR